MKSLLHGMLLVGMALGLSTLPLRALASSAAAVARQAEASMLVTGTLVVAPDGSVRSYQLDHVAMLPTPVTDLIGKNVPQWRFEPVLLQGRPVAAKADMSLRIVARRSDDDRYALSIHGAHFGDRAHASGIRRDHMVAPVYPAVAIHAHVSGLVYLVLKVDAQGKVDDVAAEQVNLGVADASRSMERWRDMLARASIRAARQWTFKLDTENQRKARDGLLLRVPVNYALHAWGEPRGGQNRYGQWKVYIPGPRQPIPWFDHHSMLTDSADALPGGGVYPIDNDLHLKTPLGGA